MTNDFVVTFQSLLAIVIAWTSVSVATGQTTVGPDEVLSITSSTAEDFVLSGGTLAPTAVTLSGSIELQSTSAIIRPQNPLIVDRGGSFERSLGPTNIDGSISGAGDLTIFNRSRDSLYLRGDNSYTGQTLVGAGQVFATTPTAFGSPSAGTTVQGGYLTIQAPTEEQFRVEGGVLRFDAGDFVPTLPVTIAGGEVILPKRDQHTMPAVVDGPGGMLTFTSGNTSSWTGGSVGTGTLGLAGRINVDAPLTHDGGLIIRGAQLNVANTYTGDTTIMGDAVINHRDALGTATTPIVMEDGTLLLNGIPTGDRRLVVKRGSLTVNDTASYDGPLSLGGTFDVSVVSNGAFNGPIDYVTTPGGGYVHLRKGTFNGPIRGTTEIRLGSSAGDVVLNAANEIDARATVLGGKVIVNHLQGVKLASTQIQQGVLDMNVPATQSPFLTGYQFDASAFGTLRLNVDQEIEDTWIINEGVVESTADVKLRRLLLLGVGGKAVVTATDGGSLEIGDELLVASSGAIEGGISGNGDIRLAGSRLTVAGDMSNFTGNYHVQSGILTFGYSPSGFTVPTILNPDSEIHVYPGGTLSWATNTSTNELIIENDIYLHNAHASNGYQGAIFGGPGNGTRILRGRIDVGDEGSTIAGSFRVEGRLTGTNLTFGNGSLGIVSPQNQLRGQLEVDNGAGISLLEEGQLHGVDSILLNQNSVLGIAPVLGGPQDRVGDDIEIKSRGGRISNISISYDNRATTETLGKLHLLSGLTEIYAYYDSAAPNQSLKFASLEREPGAILRFSLHSSAGGAGFTERPVLENGMIGPWAITDNGFATLDANGAFATLAATSSNLDTAGPTDHVVFGGSHTLMHDTTIASLQVNPTGDPEDFDLGGHQLKILSGGIFRASPEIRNGTLTAGDGQNAELVLHHTSNISADIVDNSESGSVSLVIGNNEFTTRLSGHNSYTGGTWINGDGGGSYSTYPGRVIIETFAAIPENDRVYVQGGNYDMLELPVGTINLAELHLRNAGQVNGFNAALNIRQLFLEQGTFNAPLVGDGSIYKDSDQVVQIGNVASPGFTGKFVVRGGVVSMNSEMLPNAHFELDGGRLEVTGSRNFTNHVTLNGGTIDGGRLTGEILVQGDSTLYADGFTTIYGSLKGTGDLSIRGTLDDTYISKYVGIFGDASQFNGNIDVQSGALRIGAPGGIGGGVVSVMSGARLILGSDQETSPPTTLGNTIHLNSGTLISTPPRRSFDGVAPPSVASGDVYVHTEAFIGSIWLGRVGGNSVPGLSLAGRLILDDNAHVYGLSDARNTPFGGDVPLVDISGELLVGENAVWNLQTSSLAVSGSIRPANQHGSIDFVGVESSLNLSHASFEVQAGQSLAVTINGEIPKIALRGSNSGISGNGAVSGSFELSDGAIVAPGNSAGMLTIHGSSTIGESAVYKWEIASDSGVPGMDWDLLHVDGDLLFDATVESPWVLEIVGLPGFDPRQTATWLVASAGRIIGFDPDAVEIRLSDLVDAWPTLKSDRFILHAQNGDLTLQLVPEPSMWLLVGYCLAWPVIQRHRWHKSSRS